jgi:large subunit ribosomal protein L36e
MVKSIAVGLEKGYPTRKRELTERQVKKKGIKHKRTALAREVVREVAGFAPYEKRILELLKNNLDKRALRLAKKRVCLV